jgi:hypothetical protein
MLITLAAAATSATFALSACGDGGQVAGDAGTVDGCVPTGKESCNGKDDDCDGQVDEGFNRITFYTDADRDGYGSSSSTLACKAPEGYVSRNGDCNDNNKEINPGATEQCNETDDNCNGFVDEGFTSKTYFLDQDGDGYGSLATQQGCRAPTGYVDKGGDCNDFNKDIHPGATEQCNKLDDDCDGKIDEEVTQLTIYRDNDGDGFAAENAASQKNCKVEVGWTLAKDADGDGVNDWDCDDSDVTIYPLAPTRCDGKDNNCDGFVDRLCFSTCPGNWKMAPFKLATSKGIYHISTVDLDGDGLHELVVQDTYGFAILDHLGKVLYQYAKNEPTQSRGRIIVADIDDYQTFKNPNQTLEVLTGNGSYPTFYKVNLDRSLKIYTETKNRTYDDSRFIARDLDGDGAVEFIGSTWCGSLGTKFYRFDAATSTINYVNSITEPDQTCDYWTGRVLTDLNGDGTPEFMFGNGDYQVFRPQNWGGRIHAYKFTDTKKLTTAAHCSAGSCFSTAITALYGGAVMNMMRVGSEIRAEVLYFTSKDSSAKEETRFWRYDLTGKALTGSPSTSNTLWTNTTDVDRDGTPENFGAYVAEVGLYDVNGDTYPDRIYSDGTQLRIGLWDKTSKTFVENKGSRFIVSGQPVDVFAAWDIDKDGRLEVLTADFLGRVTCHSLGKGSWSKTAALPPHFTLYARTYQWDNYEPNEGADTTKDGVPDAYVQVPSALTFRGDFYAYLSSAKDKDFYLLHTLHFPTICLQAPMGKSLKLSVYSYADLWNNSTKKTPKDGKVDGLVWTGTSKAGGEVCFESTSVSPPRLGEGKFVVGVEPATSSDFSPFWPYWLQTKKYKSGPITWKLQPRTCRAPLAG